MPYASTACGWSSSAPHFGRVRPPPGAIGNPKDKPYGSGVLLWFEIDDFDAAVARLFVPFAKKLPGGSSSWPQPQ